MKIKFQPGKLGYAHVPWNESCVREVVKNSQFFRAGVQPGWSICNINGYRFSISELTRISSGNRPYTITFQRPLVTIIY